MFNDDEVRSAFTKMYNYSPVDGFVEIADGLGGMIKSLANEPSVGLFYVQQHAHNAVPNVLNLRDNVVAKSREISLHTEDSEDSIMMLRSMTDCGFLIVDDMVKDVTKCLAIMSSKQPQKGLISSRSWSRTTWVSNVNDAKKSTIAKQKSTDLKWAPQHTSECAEESANAMANVGEELPVSSCISVGDEEADVLVDKLLLNVSVSENFDGFKADKEARFEEWLEGNGDTEHKREL